MNAHFTFEFITLLALSNPEIPFQALLCIFPNLRWLKFTSEKVQTECCTLIVFFRFQNDVTQHVEQVEII